MTCRTPTFQDFESADIPEELFRSPPSLDGLQPNRRLYSEREWAAIRPYFTLLYIDQDMILRDVIMHLRTNRDFHPTEQMCKKRISKWGLSKNIKAHAKEEALNRFRQGLSPAFARQQIRPDKLVRYEKSSASRGCIGTASLSNNQIKSHIMRAPRREAGRSQFTDDGKLQTTVSVNPKVTPSLALPDTFAATDLLLRATKVLMLVPGPEPGAMQTRSTGDSKIDNFLQDGMSLWLSHAFSPARSAFSNAAHIILGNSRRGIESSPAILYYLCPKSWHMGCQSVFREFSQFVIRASCEYMSSTHPFTLVAKQLQDVDNDRTVSLMWDCILDSFPSTIGSANRWWELAMMRWLYCFDAGLYDLAIQNCRGAVTNMRKMNLLTTRMEIESHLTLGKVYLRQRQESAAQRAFQRVLELAQDMIPSFWQPIKTTLDWLAKIHGDHSQIFQAREYLEQSLELVLDTEGIQGPETVETFVNLLRFCQRYNLRDDLARLENQYADSYSHVQEITDGLWYLDIQDDSTEVDLSNEAHKIEQEIF